MSEQRKWTTGDVGPRQLKSTTGALGKLHRELNTFTEITGVIGGEEHRSSLTQLFGTGAVNEYAANKYAELGERYGWTITAANHKAIIADAEAFTLESVEHRPIDDKRRTPEVEAERVKARAADNEKREQADAKAEAMRAQIMAKKPAKAQALIVAEYEEDRCETQTDYFASESTRRVAIGWRTGGREDFRQLRRAAAALEETAHLGPGCDVWTARLVLSEDDGHQRAGQYTCGDDDNPARADFTTEADLLAWIAERTPGPREHYATEHASIEHRENYSMGAGNYLKACSRYGTGWKVLSYPLGGRAYTFRALEDHIPELASKTTAAPVTVDGVTVRQNDERDGVEVIFPDKPDESIRAGLKAHGFRWSRPQGLWYAKRTPDRLSFAQSLAKPPECDATPFDYCDDPDCAACNAEVTFDAE